jgi:hypothetical protein
VNTISFGCAPISAATRRLASSTAASASQPYVRARVRVAELVGEVREHLVEDARVERGRGLLVGRWWRRRWRGW